MHTNAGIAWNTDDTAGVWATVDGLAVKSSHHRVPENNGATDPLSAAGVTEQSVAAGAHNVSLALACVTGTAGGAGSDSRLSAAVIVLG